MGLDDDDAWSPVAAEWAARWGAFAAPAQLALLDAVGPVDRLLDVGCGSGELLRLAADRGIPDVAGCDPSPAMLALAAVAAPGADLRAGSVEALPWADGAFDLVTAVNALHLADDEAAALQEVRRVLAPGGAVAIASWAERARNDLDLLETAVADVDGEALPADAPGRLPGGLEALLASSGFTVVAAGIVEAPWLATDADALVAGVLLGEDEATLADLQGVLVDAAAPFRTPEGSYRLVNHLRWAVGRI